MSSTSNFERQSKLVRFKKRLEGEYPSNAWSVFGSSYKDYCDYFRVSPSLFESFIEDKRKSGHEPFALDLLASTTALRSLGVSGIAVGLTDPRNPIEKSADRGKREVLAIDLYHDRKTAWKVIEDKLLKSGRDSFDLIMQRGIAGLDLIGRGPLRRLYHLQQMWNILAPNGLILTETELADLNILKERGFIRLWNSTAGIQAKIVNRGLILEKSPGAPSSLPIPPIKDSHELIRQETRRYD